MFNVFLQLLDDGRLTDGQGRVVNFKNTVIIMTSNIGSPLILEAKDPADIKDALFDMLKAQFKPEFLNRIDETVIFNRLGEQEILKIVEIQLQGLKRRLLDRKITLNVPDTVKLRLAEQGFDPLYGARPLKRVIQNEISNKLAREIIAGTIVDGAAIQAVLKDGAVVFAAAPQADG